MAAVSRLLDFQERHPLATLVLVDLHGPQCADLDESDFSQALEKCASALAYARQSALPVAFVRQKPLAGAFAGSNVYPSWLRGFRPYRTDMVFERGLPSCYASMEFSDMAARTGDLVLAGLFGETSCLSTLIEASNRKHRFTFLADASASRGQGGVSPREIHRGVAGIASVYCSVSSTDAWIAEISRKFGTAG